MNILDYSEIPTQETQDSQSNNMMIMQDYSPQSAKKESSNAATACNTPIAIDRNQDNDGFRLSFSNKVYKNNSCA